MNEKGWIGCDLDRTLAHYDTWRGAAHIGEPIAPMVARVKRWLAEGREVRILTARVARTHQHEERVAAIDAIGDWCERHLGQRLRVTSEKDGHMLELWDDRAVRVEPNVGLVGGLSHREVESALVNAFECGMHDYQTGDCTVDEVWDIVRVALEDLKPEGVPIYADRRDILSPRTLNALRGELRDFADEIDRATLDNMGPFVERLRQLAGGR
jgi:hypothetical protein